MDCVRIVARETSRRGARARRSPVHSGDESRRDPTSPARACSQDDPLAGFCPMTRSIAGSRPSRRSSGRVIRSKRRVVDQAHARLRRGSHAETRSSGRRKDGGRSSTIIASRFSSTLAGTRSKCQRPPPTSRVGSARRVATPTRRYKSKRGVPPARSSCICSRSVRSASHQESSDAVARSAGAPLRAAA